MPSAAIVVIGDEILSGKTADTNTPFLLQELRALGVSVQRILVVPDQRDAIAEAIRSVQPRFDYVFTSGGVGPTHDDVTLESIASALGRALVRDPHLERLIRDLYVGRTFKEANLRMADVPEGTELILAPGMRIPLLRLENIYILPGIPEIFREKFQSVKERFRAAPFHLRRFYCRRGEGHLAPLLADLVRDFPEVAVGSYPTLTHPDYRVQVTLESKDEEQVRGAAERFRVLVGTENIVKSE